MRLLKIILLTVFILSPALTFAQINNRSLYDEIPMNEKDTTKFLFSFSNKNFLINNEYFGNILTGYTLFGSMLTAKAGYMINKYARIDAGIFLRKDFGNPRLMAAPVLTLKLQKNGFSFLFGTLEGGLTHQLIQPIFNYERVVTHPLENGLQFKLDKKKFWMDAWIDWEKQQYQNVNFKEEIGAGISTKTVLYNYNNVFKIILPIQAFVFHHGGQLDTDTTSLLTLANAAAGLTFDWDLSKKGSFISEIRSDNYLVGFSNGSTKKNVFPYYTTFDNHINDAGKHNLNYFPSPIKSGYGAYFNLTVTSKYHISLMASYWQGHNFVAAHGGELYQSVSSIAGSNFMETNRQLIILRALYQKELMHNLFLDVRLEPYYDLNSKISGASLEYCYSIFATYKKQF